MNLIEISVIYLMQIFFEEPYLSFFHKSNTEKILYSVKGPQTRFVWTAKQLKMVSYVFCTLLDLSSVTTWWTKSWSQWRWFELSGGKICCRYLECSIYCQTMNSMRKLVRRIWKYLRERRGKDAVLGTSDMENKAGYALVFSSEESESFFLWTTRWCFSLTAHSPSKESSSCLK